MGNGFTSLNLETLVKILEKEGSLKETGRGSHDEETLARAHLKHIERYFDSTVAHDGLLNERGLELARAASLFLGLKNVWAEKPVIRIGAPDSMIDWLIMPGLATLGDAVLSDLKKDESNRIKGLRFTVKAMSPAQVHKALQACLLDFGVIRDYDYSDDLWLGRKELGKIEFFLVVPKSRKSSNSDPIQLLQEKHLRIVFQDNSRAFGEWSEDNDVMKQLTKSGRFDGDDFKPEVLVDGYPQAAKAILSGSYVGILPSLAKAELGYKKFDWLPFSPSLMVKMAVVYREDSLSVIKKRAERESVRAQTPSGESVESAIKQQTKRTLPRPQTLPVLLTESVIKRLKERFREATAAPPDQGFSRPNRITG